MIATTIEQSKHLLELGLDPDSADMYYTGHRSIFNPKEIEYTQEPRVRAKFVSFDRLEVFFPTWSLSALLEVMPKKCEPDIQKSPISGVYFAHFFVDGKPHITDDHGNAVCAAYEMVCWLLGQGFIEKGGNDGRD